jgi:hypothetical protein
MAVNRKIKMVTTVFSSFPTRLWRLTSKLYSHDGTFLSALAEDSSLINNVDKFAE